MTNRAELFSLGRRHGVTDYNNNEVSDLDELVQGYLAGYKMGQEEAVVSRWHIVSVKHKKSWYRKEPGDEMNSWVENKELATSFKNEAEAMKTYSNLLENCGRGEYRIIWESE